MRCELCGKKEGCLQVRVEGSLLVACNNCKNFGSIVGPIKKNFEENFKRIVKKESELPSENVMDDYAIKIRHCRERLGKTQEEFAQIIREKVSIVHKIETGRFAPSLELAKKLERVLKISLVENCEQVSSVVGKEKVKNAGFTIGDFIRKNA